MDLGLVEVARFGEGTVRVLRRLLEKDPERRPTDDQALEMVRDLKFEKEDKTDLICSADIAERVRVLKKLVKLKTPYNKNLSLFKSLGLRGNDDGEIQLGT